MTGKWYAKEFEEDHVEQELDDIMLFANEGTPVVLIDDLESFCDEMDVELSEIEVV
jgi:hypothetical protein